MNKEILRKLFRFSLTMLFLFLNIPSHADEILFRNPAGMQTGTVVDEDPEGITIRFSKDSIKSIRRDGQIVSSGSPPPITWEQHDDQLIVKIPLRCIQYGEMNLEKGSTARFPQTSISQKEPENPLSVEPDEGGGIQEAMLKEELGRVQGTIIWRKRPLQSAKVMIVLERYTGFSLQAVKKKYLKSGNQAIYFETLTDSQGRYFLEGVPPGEYRLYWLPDKKNGWMRRLREEPDLEVISGRITQLNIPARRQ